MTLGGILIGGAGTDGTIMPLIRGWSAIAGADGRIGNLTATPVAGNGGRRPRRIDMATGPAHVLDVGNCDPDHGMISRMLMERFHVRIDRVMFVADALARMRQNRYDLILVNRLVFADGSEGLELVTAAKADPALRDLPVMMISNYEDAQARAVAAGAERGFGKDSVRSETTYALLARFLPPRE